MHSLVFLCARRLVSHRPSARRALDLLPAELYPVLFRAAFLDRRTLVLQDLVATWPFPILSFQQLLGHHDQQHSSHQPSLRGRPNKLCIQAVIMAVVAHLRQALEEPCHGTSKRQCRLRVLDMTGVQDLDTDCGPNRMSLWSSTVVLAKACIEVSKHKNECHKHGSKRQKGSSGASATPQPFSMEIRADLFVNGTSFNVLRDALQTAAGPLRLRCRDFHTEELSITGIVSLLESLDPVGVRRVDLRFNNLGPSGLCTVLPHITRFTKLLSLNLSYSNVDVRRLTSRTDTGLRQLAAQLGRLPCLKELNFSSSRLSGNLRQLLGDLQAPLESLELAFCYLLPGDLAFLCQSIHALALRRLDLSGHNFTENLLQSLCQLLEEISASLLHLDLMECHLTDARLADLLPVLCRCSRLRCLGLFGNPLSTSGLKTLVRKTVVLPDLHLVVYPYPVDCYSQESSRLAPTFDHLSEDTVDKDRFAVVSAELARMLASSGRADAVWTTSLCCHGALDYFTL
ncbi:LRC14 protein, partial [Glaucidium brasilianum]|nr:LRC14 protein [Glaucidium brasilianum]